jgi:hypothetical protein
MDRSRLASSAQRALLEKVTPNLREVHITIENEAFLLVFFYDKPPSEDEQELASLADAEFSADFPPPEFETDYKVIVLPYPTRISSQINGSRCVYARYEPEFSNSE